MPWSGRDSNGGWPDSAWMPLDEAHFKICVDKQNKDTDSALVHCRRLLSFRKGHRALIDGSIRFIESPKDVLAFVRASEQESILCVFNLSRTEQQWMPEVGPVDLSSGWLFGFGGSDRANPALLPPLGGYMAEI